MRQTTRAWAGTYTLVRSRERVVGGTAWHTVVCVGQEVKSTNAPLLTCILGSIRPSTLAFITLGHRFRRSATSRSFAPSSSRKKAAFGRRLPVTLKVRRDGWFTIVWTGNA